MSDRPGLIRLNRFALLMLIEQMYLRAEFEISARPSLPRLRVLRSALFHLDRAVREVDASVTCRPQEQSATVDRIVSHLEMTAFRWLSPMVRSVSDELRIRRCAEAIRQSRGDQ